MVGPAENEGLAEFVFPVFAKTGEGNIKCAGSCVVIATAKRRAIALTALHLLDGVLRSNDATWEREQRMSPHFRLPRFGENFRRTSSDKTPNLPEMFVVIPKTNAIAVVTSVGFHGGSSLDIACLSLEIADGFNSEFTTRCAISSKGPKLGAQVLLCGFPEGNEYAKIANGSAQVTWKQAWLSGHVTSRFDWQEDYFVRSPGLIIDAPSPSGFSGGPVVTFHPTYGPVLSAIISTSDQEITKAALVWPALGLSHNIPVTPGMPDTLLGLMAIDGAIVDTDAAINHVSITDNPNCERLTDYIAWLDPKNQ